MTPDNAAERIAGNPQKPATFSPNEASKEIDPMTSPEPPELGRLRAECEGLRPALQAAAIAGAAYVLQGICYGLGAAIGVLPVVALVWWLS